MYEFSTRRYDRWQRAAHRTMGASALVVPPVDEPVDVLTVKRHGRLQDDMDVDLLPLRIRAARELVEAYTGLCPMTQTWSYTVDWMDPTGSILLPKAPLVDVLSVTSYDSLNVGTAVSTSQYRVERSGARGRVLLNEGFGWEWSRLYGGLVVQYRVGYGDHTVPGYTTAVEDVPASIRQAIILLATQWSTYLEAASDVKVDEMPFGFRALLDPLRVAA